MDSAKIDSVSADPVPTITLRSEHNHAATAWYETRNAPRPRAGALAVGAAIVLAVAITIHLSLTSVIDWSLPFYVGALLIGWCGETWLRGGAIGEQVRGRMRAIRRHRWELAALTLLSAGGLGLRLWMANRYGFLHGTDNDELAVAYQAWQLAHGTSPWPLYVVENGGAALYQPYSLAFLIFGAGMHTLRVTIAVENALLIPAFYLLARQFTAMPAALCATALLAWAYWPATLGMMAFGMVISGVFQSLGLALLLYGFRRGSFTASAAGGGVLAVCFYGYLGARVMALAALPVLLFFLFGGSGAPRRRIALSAAFCFGFVALLMPWVATLWNNPDLVQGDISTMNHHFVAALHGQAPDGFSWIWDQAVQLSTTLFITPRVPTYFQVQSGGLLDGFTATLGVVAVGYAVLRCWKLDGALIVCAVAPPLMAASIVDGPNVYRLGSAIPGLFLAIAMLLNRCLPLARALPDGGRVGIAILVLFTGASGRMNLSAIDAHVGNNSYICQDTAFFSNVRSQDITVADTVNALGSGHAVFLITHDRGYDQPDQPPWLYHQPPPVLYNARSGSSDPATWKVLNPYPPPPVGPPHATFWPPRLGTGQVAITYLILNDDDRILLPRLLHDYPGGESRRIGLDSCPTTYSLISYTLSARQLATDDRKHLGTA